MGMCGQYIAIDKEVLKRLENEEIGIYDIDIDESNSIDIDKSWDALHFMFKNKMETVVPLDFNYLIEEYTESYVYHLMSYEVSETYEYLEGIDENGVKTMFNFLDMCDEEVYPITDGENEHDFFEYIYSNFVQIKEFFKRVAEEGKLIIFYVS